MIRVMGSCPLDSSEKLLFHHHVKGRDLPKCFQFGSIMGTLSQLRNNKRVYVNLYVYVCVYTV